MLSSPLHYFFLLFLLDLVIVFMWHLHISRPIIAEGKLRSLLEQSRCCTKVLFVDTINSAADNDAVQLRIQPEL